MKILICGLPGSGKTWLAERLVKRLKNCAWYNADIIRKYSNDWDFSNEGRIRQAKRMKTFADFEIINGRWVVCDFVAPTKKSRDAFSADYIIWLDTINQGRVVDAKIKELQNIENLPFNANELSKSKEFDDTNKIFEPPDKIDKHINKFLDDKEIDQLAREIVS
ncbi:MAG: hypothetical protein CFH19_00540 [Alphaproteobacteria bacterium MarineAlpha5_Bin9]|nr:MAG: hypothetical protein CFH19_00540 [Alphaproteobacteria bacterium MarineAlpha5_Bin9]|tara:strand:- start:1445 stop:1936 length:492 start_codon:yes stop_codon:yes gene_type:complete